MQEGEKRGLFSSQQNAEQTHSAPCRQRQWFREDFSKFFLKISTFTARGSSHEQTDLVCCKCSSSNAPSCCKATRDAWLGMEGCVGSGTGEVPALACQLALLKAKLRFGRAQTAVGNTRSPELLAPSSSVVVLPEMCSPVMVTAASWPFLVLPPSLHYCFLCFPPETSGWGAVAKTRQTVEGVLGEHACAKQAASAEDHE